MFYLDTYYINDLSKIINKDNNMVLYADDLVSLLMIQGS
jgi:hypothetical protein